MTESSTYTIHAGDDVYGSDGEKVGSVIAVESHYVVVEKGWFFPTDYYIPFSAVASYQDGQITLNVTKEAALDQGWDTEPVLTDGAATPGITSDPEALSDTDAVGEATAPATGRSASDARTTMTGNTLRIPVYEEELSATRTARNVAGIRIEKIIPVEDQSLDLAATELRLKVVRRGVDRSADAAKGDVFEEVFIDVPLDMEAFDVANGVRAGEEIVITKEVVQRVEQVMGTVRREEVRVTEAPAGALLDNTDRVT